MMNALPDQGITTDDLTGVSGLSHRELAKAMAALETGVSPATTSRVTVAVHVGVENQSRQRMATAMQFEKALIARMRELAPDADAQNGATLDLTGSPCPARRGAGKPEPAYPGTPSAQRRPRRERSRWRQGQHPAAETVQQGGRGGSGAALAGGRADRRAALDGG